MDINLTREEAVFLCEFIEDEQYSFDYEHYWSPTQRERIDNTLFKVRKAIKEHDDK